VGYRAPRSVKPHGWQRSASMMAVEAWLSYLNWTVIYGFERSLAWQFHGKREYAGPGTPPGACIIHRRYDPAHCGAVVALPQRQPVVWIHGASMCGVITSAPPSVT
jgi:hypothetical protein